MKHNATWNFDHLMTDRSQAAIEQALNETKQAAQTFNTRWKSRCKEFSDPTILAAALADMDTFDQDHHYGGAAGYFASLSEALDQLNPEVKQRYNLVYKTLIEIGNSLTWFGLAVSHIDPKYHTQILEHSDIAPYKHSVHRAFAQAKYALSESEENILSMFSKPAKGNWVSMTQEFLAKEEHTVLTEEETEAKRPFPAIASLMNSTKQTVRDRAAEAFNTITKTHADVAAHELNSVLEYKRIHDELRGYTRPDQSRHLADDIESSIVDAMLEAVTDDAKTAQDFYALKAAMLKKNTLAYHERNVPTGTLDHLSFDYDTSIDLVSDVFHGLDHEFGTIFDGFVSEGLVDAFPRKGKAAGAFCAHTAITLPTYILLNHTNTLNDVLTIAHEAGHGINNEMIRKVQNATNFGTPTSTAEVASTFMEDFVLEHLAQGVSEQDRITLNMTKLNSDISSIHRQVACYRFEQALHTEYRETGHLTTDRIGELFQKNMAHYMGPAVEQSAGSETWWVYWSHIRNYFYVYSYASGLLISKALQAKVREDKSYLESVKTFLSAGTSASPKDIFLNIGIDLTDATFWKSGLHEIRTLLDETTDAWKNLNPDNQ